MVGTSLSTAGMRRKTDNSYLVNFIITNNSLIILKSAKITVTTKAKALHYVISAITKACFTKIMKNNSDLVYFWS